MSSTVKAFSCSTVMEKKIVFGYIVMAVSLVIGGYIFYLSFIVAQKVDFERVRLEREQISVFQFCSEIGKLAADESACKEYNLLHGNDTGQDFLSQVQKDFSK
jgi:hypothetical protein